jgi:adenine deaminase
MFHVERNFFIMEEYVISGRIVDPIGDEIFEGEITVRGNKISSVIRKPVSESVFILPGLIDSHVHVESSMMTPARFAEAIVPHGTVAVVADPHEIANVLGMSGIRFMVKNSKRVPFKFYFGAPSCVPATNFESSGAKIDVNHIDKLFSKYDFLYLSEMMNFPGVIHGDKDVLSKIQLTHKYGKKIDGHAPGLSGEDLKKYVSYGISTDHECFTYEEALNKIKAGMMIQIREGSAAKNFNVLYKLIDEYPDKVMLCSDDLHPDQLMFGHINRLLKKGVALDVDLFNLIKAASVNAVIHYGLDNGLLQVGDKADFCLVEDLTDFKVLATYINGKCVYEKGEVKFKNPRMKPPNSFYSNNVSLKTIQLKDISKKVKVIEAVDGELITKKIYSALKSSEGDLIADLNNDILKLVVVNRYEKEKPAVGFIKNMGLKKGGMISSIAHDSHNIIATGTSDEIILDLIRWIQKEKGGIAIHTGKEIIGLELPVAGLMSDRGFEYVQKRYMEMNDWAHKLGSKLSAPFMTLSFMSLLVIPDLKLSNKGLFDVNAFAFTDIYENE